MGAGRRMQLHLLSGHLLPRCHDAVPFPRAARCYGWFGWRIALDQLERRGTPATKIYMWIFSKFYMWNHWRRNWSYGASEKSKKISGHLLSPSTLSAASRGPATTSPAVFEKEKERKRRLDIQQEPPIEGHSALLHDPAKKRKSTKPKFTYIVHNDGSALEISHILVALATESVE